MCQRISKYSDYTCSEQEGGRGTGGTGGPRRHIFSMLGLSVTIEHVLLCYKTALPHLQKKIGSPGTSTCLFQPPGIRKGRTLTPSGPEVSTAFLILRPKPFPLFAMLLASDLTMSSRPLHTCLTPGTSLPFHNPDSSAGSAPCGHRGRTPYPNKYLTPNNPGIRSHPIQQVFSSSTMLSAPLLTFRPPTRLPLLSYHSRS